MNENVQSANRLGRFKPYPEYRDSGVEWLQEIPAHWSAKRVKHLVSEPLKYGANEAAELTDPDLPRYIRITDVTPSGNLRGETFKSLPEEVARPYLLREGDILLARSGATVGKAFRYDSSWGRAAYAGYLIRARLREKVVASKFVMFFLQSGAYWDWLKGNTIQATIQNVSAERYSHLAVPFPDADEQRAIAAFLDRETGRVDELVAKKERLIELLQEKRSALITHAVTKGLDPTAPTKPSGIEWLGDIPAHWEVKPLKLAFRFAKGRNAQDLTATYIKDHPGEYPVYSGQTENEGVMGLVDSYEYDFDEVLFSTTVGARVMTPLVLRGRFSLSQNCLIMIPTAEDISSRFFYYQLHPCFSYERASIPDHMQPSLRVSDLQRYVMGFPPVAERHQIAAYLDKQIEGFEALAKLVMTAIEKLKEYRTALISAAVTGKIDVREEAA